MDIVKALAKNSESATARTCSCGTAAILHVRRVCVVRGLDMARSTCFVVKDISNYDVTTARTNFYL
jgi:hypothetical protein